MSCVAQHCVLLLSTMDSLDDLTNDQIRLQLVEYGLANIPVTTTTRKVQLKRLRAAIEGGAPPAGSGEKTTKNRRETIHVAKVAEKSESDAKPKAATSDNGKAKSGSSRRATISATSASAIPVKTNTPIPAESKDAPSKVSSRRTSLRASQTREAPEPVAIKPISKIPSIVDVPEESEEDVPFIPISQKRTARQSRSPSLSKSETVVTAFKQVLARATPIPEEIVNISDEEEEENDEDFETSVEPELAQYSDFRKQAVEPSKTSYNRSSVGASFANSTTYKPFVAEDFKSSTTQRRYTTTTSSLSQPPVEQRHRTPEKSSIGDGGSIEVNTPYLSDFTRRLSKLRAEPLNEERLLRRESAVGLDEDDLYYRTSSQVHGRHQLRKAAPKGTAWSYIKFLVGSFEQKYRKYIWPIVFLLLVIFVLSVVLG